MMTDKINELTARIMAETPCSRWPEDRIRATLASLPDLEDQTLIDAAGNDGPRLAEALGLTGVAKGYRPDGSLMWRATYKHGQRHGLWEEFHPDGTLAWRATYEDDNRHGLVERFRPDGTLEWRGTCQRGKLVEGWQ